MYTLASDLQIQIKDQLSVAERQLGLQCMLSTRFDWKICGRRVSRISTRKNTRRMWREKNIWEWAGSLLQGSLQKPPVSNKVQWYNQANQCRE